MESFDWNKFLKPLLEKVDPHRFDVTFTKTSLERRLVVVEESSVNCLSVAIEDLLGAQHGDTQRRKLIQTKQFGEVVRSLVVSDPDLRAHTSSELKRHQLPVNPAKRQRQQEETVARLREEVIGSTACVSERNDYDDIEENKVDADLKAHTSSELQRHELPVSPAKRQRQQEETAARLREEMIGSTEFLSEESDYDDAEKNEVDADLKAHTSSELQRHQLPASPVNHQRKLGETATRMQEDAIGATSRCDDDDLEEHKVDDQKMLFIADLQYTMNQMERTKSDRQLSVSKWDLKTLAKYLTPRDIKLVERLAPIDLARSYGNKYDTMKEALIRLSSRFLCQDQHFTENVDNGLKLWSLGARPTKEQMISYIVLDVLSEACAACRVVLKPEETLKSSAKFPRARLVAIRQ